MAGQATAALATPATAPTASVAVNETLTPVLHGVSTNAGTGSHTMHFFARTVGSPTWNLLNDAQVAGGNEFAQLPSGQLSIGQGFEYQVEDCDSSGCAASAIQTGYVSPDLAAGQRQGATRLPFTIGDKISAQVDVGTGNLFVSTTQLSLPRISGSLDLGVAFNSLTLAPGSRFTSVVSPGWRVSTGEDVRLITNDDGSVTFYGPDGVTGTFFPDGQGGYSSANTNIKGSVASGPIFTDHSTGDAYHFDSHGRLQRIVSKNGTWTSFGGDYTHDWNSVSTDKGGAAGAAGVSFDGSGRLSGFDQSPSGGTARSVTYSYDGNGRLSQITDTLGRHTDFGYNTAGDLTSITAPGGAETDFTYDGGHRVTSVTQPSAGTTNAITRLVYTSGQTLLATPNTDQSQPVSAVPHTTYDLATTGPSAGQLLVQTATDPNNKKRSATYSPFDDVASTTDNAGNQTNFGYPSDVNNGESFTGTTLPTGATTQFKYDNPAGSASQFYPSNGTDSQKNSSTFTYNGTGNMLTSADDSSGAKAKIDYNSDGTVMDAVDPAGNQTSYTYVTDSTGKSIRLIATITPPTGSGLGVRTYTYDAYGRIATYQTGRLDGSGQPITQTFSYDAGDRVTQVDYSDGTPSVHYTYNDAGQVATRTDASGTTTYTYDPLGRLASRVSTAGGGLLSYGYDLDGNLVSETDGNGTTTDAYDSRDLLTSTTTPDGRVIGFGYDDDARRTDTWFATTSGNGSWAAHTKTAYDASGRVTRVTTSRASSDSNLVSDLSYSYAAPASSSCATVAAAQGTDTGLRWAQTDNLTGLTTGYCYDSQNRLTSATTPGGDTWTYAYDTNGNRTQVTKNGTTVQSFAPFDSGNQLTPADGYSYDKAGNLTTAPGNLHLSYNGSDQQTGRTGSGTSSWTYAGTDQTELTAQTVPGGSSYTYAYGRTDQNGLPLLDTFTNPNGTNYLTHDDRGTPLAIKTWQGSYSYYVLDGLGSPVAMVNPTGTVQATYSYDPWGTVTVNNPTNSTVANLQPYRFAGGMLDRSTGYVKFGMRYYDPGTGRWTQQDSVEVIGDPTRGNRYEYAGDNPTNNVDPTGKSCLTASIELGISAILTVAAIGVVVGTGGAAAAAGAAAEASASAFASNVFLANLGFIADTFTLSDVISSC